MGDTPISARALASAIARRYGPPEWHIVDELTLRGRRLDVVAMNMWAARGYRIVGFEIKASRGDWLRELSAFEKSEEWASVVDSFYVVTPKGLVRPDELPAGWGLLELCGTRLMNRRHPEKRSGRTLPRELAARFLTRTLVAMDQARRERDDRVPAAEVDAKVQAKVEERVGAIMREHEETARRYRELLDALGVNPYWNPGDRVIEEVRRINALAGKDKAVEMVRRRLAECDGPLALLHEALAGVQP